MGTVTLTVYQSECVICGEKVSFELSQDRKTGNSKAENVSVL